VFRLTSEGLELCEVAPGVDVERDILAKMTFRPLIRPDLPLMDRRIFRDEPMRLQDDLAAVPLGKG
jgi:propionate CoA-transferase